MRASDASPIAFNGIFGTTGRYATSTMPLCQLVQRLCRRLPAPGLPRGLLPDIDPLDLASAGWGVVFRRGTDSAVRRALRPLLSVRQEQATPGKQRESRYFELDYLPGETVPRFLARHGSSPGPVDPRRLPYFLLLVGGPEDIPFSFQYGLGVQHAVGRLGFETTEEYGNYARSAITNENTPKDLPRRVALVGPQHVGDEATETSVRHLVRPLAERLEQLAPSWSIDTVVGPQATSAHLRRVLQHPYSLVFTAGHAVLFPPGHSKQRPLQGGLLGSDWSGPVLGGLEIPEDFYLTADDLEPAASRRGLISFHFACCSLGTPRHDLFDPDEPQVVAHQPFLARLPQRLLGHESGSLAVIGHIGRAWEQSFVWDRAGQQVGVFVSALHQILQGKPVGLALADFGTRHAELSTMILELQNQRLRKASRDRLEEELPDGANLGETSPEENLETLANLWTAYHDARSYALLGDPAVRLNLSAPPTGHPSGDLGLGTTP